MVHLRATPHRARTRRPNRWTAGVLALTMTAGVAAAGCSNGFQARDLAGARTGTGEQPEGGTTPVTGPATTAVATYPALAPSCDGRTPTVSALQKGTTRITGTTSVTLPTIAVAAERTFLLFAVRGSGDHAADVAVRGRLASDTSLEFLRPLDLGAPTAVDVEWSLVEFACGVRVQRGEIAVDAPTVPAPLADPVAVDRSFLLWSSSPAPTGDPAAVLEPTTVVGTPTVELVDPTALAVTSPAPSGQQLWWQLVEFVGASGARVQTARASFAPDATTVSLPLPAAVDPARTFVLVGPASGVGDIAPGAAPTVAVTARLTDASTVTVDRVGGAGSGAAAAVVQVVELPSGAVVSGTVDLPAGSPSAAVPTSGLDPAHSVAFLGGQGGGGQSSAAASGTAAAHGAGRLTATVTEGQLVVRRERSDEAVRADWTVITWS